MLHDADRTLEFAWLAGKLERHTFIMVAGEPQR